MPPIGMFRGRQRPNKMAFGTCAACNSGTGGADAVAAMFATLHPDTLVGTWQADEIDKRLRAVRRFAPGVLEEFQRANKNRLDLVARRNSGLMQRVVQIQADGPITHAHLSVFGAKLAMALYREHTGSALPLDGAAWTQFALSGGMSQKTLDDRIKIMPMFATLRQGKVHVSDQFSYRFNCDGRSTIAAVAKFHKGLWLTIAASHDPKIIALFEQPESSLVPASALVRPGQLSSILTVATMGGQTLPVSEVAG
ncbi:hypothetical protein CWB41_15965 [Methylovirgula ligni]|nr:hypothetical protein CWB41_15965 [Methylovirgula ligni]